MLCIALAVPCSVANTPLHAAEELVYNTRDGWTIHATFYPSRQSNRPLLIAVHMLMSDRSYYPVRYEILKFCNVLTIDMRGHGDSMNYHGKETSWRTGIGNIYRGSFQDIRHGIEEVKRRYGERVDTGNIFLQGSSYSCVLVLQYFMKYPDNISGLIFMSPGKAYGRFIDREYYKMLRGGKIIPVFNVCSKKDGYCYSPALRMRQYYRRFVKQHQRNHGTTAGNTTFIFEDDHVHGTHFFYTHHAAYPGRIITWMRSNLRKAKERNK